MGLEVRVRDSGRVEGEEPHEAVVEAALRLEHQPARVCRLLAPRGARAGTPLTEVLLDVLVYAGCRLVARLQQGK